MPTGRDINVVIGDLLGTIPATETALRAHLERIKEQSCFRAPELAYLDWRDLQRALIAGLGSEPDTTVQWVATALRIFSGNPHRKAN